MKKKPAELESYFNFIKAAAITGIFAYHEYDFSYQWGSVGRRIGEGLLHNLFGGAHSALDYISGLFQMFFALGSTGVELFILASGFGLYLSQLKKRTPWKSFYVKRAVRILPLYWAALLLFYFMGGIQKPDSLESLVCHVLLLQNFTPYYLDYGAFWFVSYIAFLYLLFPLLTWAFENPGAKWALFLSSFFMTPLSKWLMDLNGIEFTGGEFPTRFLPIFLLGMMIAREYYKGNHRPAFLGLLSSLCALLMTSVLIVLLNYYPQLYLPYLRPLIGMLLFWGLYLFYIIIRPLSPARNVINIMAYGSYATFLLHVGLILLFARIPFVLKLVKVVSFNRNIYLYLEYFVPLVIFCYYLQKIYDDFTGRLFSRPAGLASKPGLT